MGIHSIVGFAVSDANDLARKLSLTRPEPIVAIVTRDTGPQRLLISWASTVQALAPNDTIVGTWLNGQQEEK